MFCLSFFFVIVFPFRIHGEPSSFDTFVLLEHFTDAPETGEGYHAQDDAGVGVGNHQAGDECHKAQKQECPPAFPTEMILCFDDDGVEDTYADEGSCPNE